MKKIRKIVLFTSNKSGGIVQFTEQIAETLHNIGIECVCYFPEGTSVSRQELNCRYFSFSAYESILSHNVKNVADRVIKEECDVVWFTDSPLMSLLVLIKLSPRCMTVLSIHDPKYHPTNNSSVIYSLYKKYTGYYRKKACSAAKKIILMSSESRSLFLRMFPQYSAKSILLPLGAHIPKDDPQKPAEIRATETFHLFFGVIDKYKGIGNLLDSYQESERKIPLVIAGGGKFTDDEKAKIEKSTGVIIINRYIANGEMKWLVSHAKSVVLPYIEASQSGVLPIAYSFGVPVIVSDLPGLTQFVENGKTGFVCKNKKDMAEALNMLSGYDQSDLRDNTLHYYNTHFNWQLNVNDLLLKFGEVAG